MSDVCVATHKEKKYFYRLLKLFSKLFLEKENTWWNMGHAELVKNQKLISLFPNLLHSRYLSLV